MRIEVLHGMLCSASSLAVEIIPPSVPAGAERFMPEAETFGEGLLLIIQDALPLIRPDLYEASRVCIGLFCAVILVSLIQGISERIKKVSIITAVAGISATILMSFKSMVHLAGDTVSEMTEYGKLILPVMTTALAAQGGAATSAALYAGTSILNTLISTLISKLLLPGVYILLAVGIAAAATEEEMLKKFRDSVKTLISWCLKSILTVFISYMGITGVVSGTTDAAALKAAKATISSFVPVVGGILSDASESILIGMGLAKNAAGLYGIFAVLAIYLEPFLQIGCHYLMLKITAMVCSVFGAKPVTELIGDFSSGMGLLLGMTGSVCVLQLISVVCFIKGVS